LRQYGTWKGAPMKRCERKNLLAATVAAALVALAGAAPAAESGASPDFNKYDTNRDGFVSREEAAKIPDFSGAFDESDDNRDGRLDSAEFLKAQSFHERQRAGHFVQDSVITAKVKAALLKDPVVKGTAVKVETHRGTVLLSGFVTNAQEVQRAAEVAAGIGGVVSVRNGLAVKG
jgi:hyperosmotically inducible periplasmic protein